MKNATWYGSCLALPLLGALGCSDPVPPPAQGSATVQFGVSSSPSAGFSCPISKTFHVGNPAPDMFGTGTPLIDGQAGSISCSVRGSGSYTFSGSLNASAAEGVLVQLSFFGQMIDGQTTYGDANAYTSDLGNSTIVTKHTDDTTMQPSQMCALTVLGNQIKPGAVWGHFNCPHMQAAPSTECAISGEMVFQDCDGS